MATADVCLTTADSMQTISVNASTRGIFTAFYKLENQYTSTCGIDFSPIKYEKNIIQKDFQEKRVITFNHKDLIARSKDMLNYPEITPDSIQIRKNTYDIFSALFAIREKLPKDTCSFYCLANSNVWKIRFKFLDRETLCLQTQEKKALKYLVQFEQMLDNKDIARTDILTNNLFSENHYLIFWFSDDDNYIPLKARYGMFPFSVYWQLEIYWHKD
jgi:hypothetical protein